MLRTFVVFVLACIGGAYTLRGPLFGLFFYLWIAYFRPEEWVWNPDLLMQLRLSYVAGIVTVIGVLVTSVRWRMNLRVAILGLFLTQALLSALFASYTNYALPLWVEFFKAIVITYLIVVLTTDAVRFRQVILMIAMSLGAEATKQGWVQLILHPGGRNDNRLSMLGDNNGVAVGMFMLLPILTTLASTTNRPWEKYLYRFMAVGVLYRGLSTYSRGGLLTCVAVALMYVLRGQKKLATAAALALVASVIVPALPDVFWERMSTIATPDKLAVDDVSSRGRLYFWSVAVDMANAHPVLGVGHNTFNANYNRFDTSNGEYGGERSVHSAWFGVLAELGYPGLLLFLGILLLAFRACARARKAADIAPQHENLRKFAFALETALVGFCVGGTFLPFQYTEMLWHVIGLSIALDGLARTVLSAQTIQVPSARDFGQLIPARTLAS